VALRVLEQLGRPLAAPSANRFGAVSPTTPEHVAADFGDQVPLVLDGGACDIGVESTIVDLTRGAARILRPGGVTQADIERVLGVRLEDEDGTGPVAPGTLEAHYTPRAELRLVSVDDLEKEVTAALDRGICLGVFAPTRPVVKSERLVYRPMADAAQTAHDLYDSLRRLDEAGCELILGTLVDEQGIGRAVADRMRRAAFGSKRPQG
jgi:L-threonylcarbamoyladenylate synthase